MNPAKARQPQEVLRQEQARRARFLPAVVDRHENLLEAVNLPRLPRFSTHRQATSHRCFQTVGAQLHRQVSTSSDLLPLNRGH